MNGARLVVLSVALSMSVPAFAVTTAAPAARPSFGARVMAGIGAFARRQFQMRADVKQALTDVKAMRKGGALTAAAERLRDAPKASGMWEKLRMWNAKRQVLGAARRDMRANRLNSDPGRGFTATETLNDAHMVSFVGRFLADRAFKKGTVNALKTAKRLGDRGRYDEAYGMLEWSTNEIGVSQKSVDLMDRLSSQALRTADRAATRAVKAYSQAEKAAMLSSVAESMALAQSFAGLSASATGEERFDGQRAARIAGRLGMSGEQMQHAIDAHMQAWARENARDAGGMEAQAEARATEAYAAEAKVAAATQEPVQLELPLTIK